MTIQAEVKYLRPRNLAEAWQALGELRGAARPVWISPQPPDPAELELESYVDLSELELDQFEQAEGRLTIGAGVRLRAIQDSDLFKGAFDGVIQRAVRKTAHQGLRNLATLGAVLLEPKTAPELASALLACGAELIYFNGEERAIKLADAWLDKSFVGLPLKLNFDLSSADLSTADIQWVGRSPMDKAIVTAAVCLLLEDGGITDINLAAAGDGFGPYTLDSTSNKLVGSSLAELDRSAFVKWVKSELSPSASYRASVEYQEEITPVLAWRALQAAFDEVKS